MRACVTVATFVIAILVCAPFVGGCSAHQMGGAPEPSSDLEADLQAIEKHYGAATAIQAALDDKADPKAARNKLIAGRLVAMNLRYLRFVRETTADKQVLDSASDILILSLNLAGAALGDKTTKTVLAAVSAGVAGSRVSLDKNFYYEKTMPALVAAMNAERRKALIPILKGMKLAVDDYPVAQAITDLDAYYHAGTLIGAINAVTSEAGDQERAANIQIRDLQAIQESRTSTLAKLQEQGVQLGRDRLAAWVAKAVATNPAPEELPLVAAEIVHHAVRTLPTATIVEALRDPAKKQKLTEILAEERGRSAAKLSETFDLAKDFDHAKLIAALDADSLARILSSSTLGPLKLLDRR